MAIETAVLSVLRLHIIYDSVDGGPLEYDHTDQDVELIATLALNLEEYPEDTKGVLALLTRASQKLVRRLDEQGVTFKEMAKQLAQYLLDHPITLTN